MGRSHAQHSADDDPGRAARARPDRSTPSRAAARDTSLPASAASSTAAPRPGCRGRRRARPAGSSAASPPGATGLPARQAVVGRGHHLARPSPSRGGSGGQHRRGGWPGGPTPCAGRTRTPGCRATSTSSRRPSAPSPGASSGGRRARRWRPRTGPPRTRGAGRSGRSPAVQVDGRAQLAQGQRRALDVPPGRPGPHSDSHDGSSGAEGCHSTKSSGSSLWGSSTLPPRSAASASISSRPRWQTWPKRSKRDTSK